jgi:hypothetical protein
MLTFAIFPFLLFFLGAALVTGLPLATTLHTYCENRGRRAVKCPASGQHADVEIDHEFALKSAMHGLEHSRLQSCSRWPEKGECGQECLAQVEPSPENLERLFSSRFASRCCAICTRDITPADWRQGRLAVLDQNQQLFEMRDIAVDTLQSTLRDTRPLCWKCHQEERARQVLPLRVLRGSRVGLASLHEPV